MKQAVKKRKVYSKGEILYHLLVCPIFVLMLLLFAYPFYYLMICTISDPHYVELGLITLLPKGINFENYLEVFKTGNLLRSAYVSLLRVVVGTGLTLFVSAYTAYFFTKENMWGRKFWYRLVVITMYFSAGIIPVYLNVRALGLLNNFWVYILPSLVSTYNMILIKTAIEAMPLDLEESAYLEGAGYLTCFLRIVLPLQKPILATVGLFLAVNHWNDFFTTKLYVTNTKLYTLQFTLYELLNQVKAVATDSTGDGFVTVTPVGIRMTLTAVVTIPVMLVYPFIQKYYVKGIMIGAVKG